MNASRENKEQVMTETYGSPFLEVLEKILGAFFAMESPSFTNGHKRADSLNKFPEHT